MLTAWYVTIATSEFPRATCPESPDQNASCIRARREPELAYRLHFVLLHVAHYIQYSYISINWFTLTVERVLFYKEA